MAGRNEKDRVGLTPEMMGQNVESSWGVSEGPGRLLRRPTFDKVSAQGFVLPLLGLARFKEESPDKTYVFRCSDMRIITVITT
jgi:hypothetical protein